MHKADETLFAPLQLTDGIVIRNRIAMAPMTTWAANDDLTISDAEDTYYRRRVGGVGLVLTGCTQVTPNGIGFTHEFAATDDRYIESLRKLAVAAKSGGAAAVLQIFHAGSKALPQLIPDGDVISASAVPTTASGFAPAQTPRALTEAEIEAIIRAFGETTRRAIAAGFDGVELHGAHGFLIQQFFSPATNQRNDDWGGTTEKRLRFAVSVVAEVKRVIAEYADRPFILGYRISPEEAGEQGYRIADSLHLIDHLMDAGIDYIHASLADALNDRPMDEPEGARIIERIVIHVAKRIPVIAAGGIRTPQLAVEALELGLDLVAVGHGLVINPNWVELAHADRTDEITTELDPDRIEALEIPEKLWAIIDMAKGWFQIRAATDEGK